MLRKLAGYVLISFLSFGLFTTLFHTVADAQASELVITPTPEVSPLPSVVAPTPTISQVIVKQEAQTPPSTPTPTLAFKLQSVDVPSVTPTAKPTEPTPTPVPSKQELATTSAPLPTAVPTAIPTEIPAPTAEPTVVPVEKPAVAIPADLDPLFTKYSAEYNVDKNDLGRIAKCEAGFNSQSDTGTYAGMFQFAAQTWISNRTAMGLDTNPDLRKNAEESIRTAAFLINRGGRHAWPNC